MSLYLVISFKQLYMFRAFLAHHHQVGYLHILYEDARNHELKERAEV
jgi:hypothetical protein